VPYYRSFPNVHTYHTSIAHLRSKEEKKKKDKDEAKKKKKKRKDAALHP